MPPERLELVRGIVDRARSLDHTQRAQFIARETAGDDGLRRAVEIALENDSRDLAGEAAVETQAANAHPVGTMARDAPAALLRICVKCQSRYGPAVRVCPADGEVLVEDPAALVGETLDGLYKIEKLLGQGGMGTVYLARHTLLQDRVAIKLLASHLSGNPTFLKRFLREGQAARAIHHPNAMMVHELRTTSDGLAYMVLEYIEGRNLREELTDQGRFTLSEALDLVGKLAAALDEAHEQGVVHRDIKPENVMLGSVRGKPAVKLLDLGIAKHSPVLEDGLGVQTAITVVGGIVGTPQYMSPEQWGEPLPDGDTEVDGRADVYSMAVMLFELVAGTRPYEGATLSEFRLAHVSEPVPRLDAVLPTVPSEVAEAIARGMAKDRRNRQSTCGQFVGEVRSALAASPAAAEWEIGTLVSDAPIDRPVHDAAMAELEIDTVISDSPLDGTHPEPRSAPAQHEIATLVSDTPLDDRAANPNARLKIAVISAVFVIGMLSTAYVLWPRAETPPALSPSSTATVLPERSFSYSVTTQKFKNGKKYKEPLDVSSGFPFTSEDKIWITVTSSEAGYLYAIGEGSTPDPKSGETPLRVLFPDPMVASGSPAVAAGSAARIPPDGVPPIDFDDTRGKEKLWIIWAAEPIPELDGIAGLLNERDRGLITTSKFERSVKELLGRSQATSTDDETKKTTVRGKGPVLVALRELEHY